MDIGGLWKLVARRHLIKAAAEVTVRKVRQIIPHLTRPFFSISWVFTKLPKFCVKETASVLPNGQIPKSFCGLLLFEFLETTTREWKRRRPENQQDQPEPKRCALFY